MLDAEQETGALLSVVDRAEQLAGIHQPQCAAVIWRRALPLGLGDWIAGLPPSQLTRSRLILRPSAVRAAADRAFDDRGTPRGRERDRLAEDIADLAEIFADIMGARWIRVHFDVVATDACRKFHMDVTRARLICTYRGSGTQYGVATDGAGPDPIHTVATGAPILLRGTAWPTDPPSKLLHRSPPIEGTGATRFVLVLDPIGPEGVRRAIRGSR